MVSHYFSLQGIPYRSVDREDFEVGSGNILRFLRDLRCLPGTYVLNCIGIVNRRVAATPLAALVRVNSLFPHELAKACESLHLRIIHVSTDCVFSGSEGGYTESSPPSPTDLYGISKALGEPLDGAMVIRSSFIGTEVKNFYLLVSWVLAQAGKVVPGYANHFWNGVTSLQFAQIIQKIMEKSLFEYGLFHVYSPVSATKEELVRMIAEAFSVNVRVNSAQASGKIDRRLCSQKTLCDMLCIPPLEKQLAELVRVALPTRCGI